jgi:DNA-binding HxlR family transcriptional regulator
MARRSYRQYCTLARTLDIVGERWTLLIIRELMLGPRRFKDLLDGLPGIGRNLLVERLRQLEREGIIRRGELPPPAASRVYELTEDGRALGPAMAELGRWGLRRLEPPGPGVTFRPGWAMFPLSYTADRVAARGVHETYEFRVDRETFHLRVDDGVIEPRSGGAHRPDLVVTMDTDTLLDLFSGALSAPAALSAGRVEVQGAPRVLERALAILAGPAE